MKRRTAIWIGIIAALVLLGALAQICRICRAELHRRQAEALVEAGAYAHARKLYDGIGDAEGVAHCNAMQAEEVYQEGKQFLMSGADTYVGGTLAVVIIREIAPAFVALSIGARAGTAISAEIANMQVTEQVDAIKTLKVDPIGYYFAPRITASAFTVPMVVIIAELVGILGGMFVAYMTIGLHPNRYINSVWLWLNTRDFYISIFKGFCFGIIIATVCATQGYETKGGAKDVGISTTQAAIKSTIYLLIADFIINFFFYL